MTSVRAPNRSASCPAHRGIGIVMALAAASSGPSRVRRTSVRATKYTIDSGRKSPLPSEISRIETTRAAPPRRVRVSEGMRVLAFKAAAVVATGGGVTDPSLDIHELHGRDLIQRDQLGPTQFQ